MKSPDPRVMKVLNAKTARGKHSPLYHWMREHHAVLRAEFELHGPQWAERVVAMGEAGLTDQTGKAATLRTAKQTWYRVCEDLKGARRKRVTKVVVKSAPESTPTPTTPSQPPPAIVADVPAEPAQKPKFRFAGGYKDWTNTKPEKD